MKKIFGVLLLGLSVVCFSSCEKSGGDDVIPQTSKTYTVTADMGIESLDAQYGTNSTLQLGLFEYNDLNEMINSQTWSNVQDNDTKTFTAHKLATKLVIYIELDTYYGDKHSELNEYVAQIYYLTNNKTAIKIDGSTRVTKTHPLK